MIERPTPSRLHQPSNREPSNRKPPAHRSRPVEARVATPVADRPTGRAGRTISLRANRVTNGVLMVVELLALLLFFFGIERFMSTNDGLVFVAGAAVIGLGVGRCLRPGRLLIMEVEPMEVRVTNAFAPETAIRRGPGLRAVIWVARRYGGAQPALRGVYLVDGEGVRSFSRPMTFSADQLKRFFAAAAIPAEIVDATNPPFAARTPGAV